MKLDVTELITDLVGKQTFHSREFSFRHQNWNSRYYAIYNKINIKRHNFAYAKLQSHFRQPFSCGSK